MPRPFAIIGIIVFLLLSLLYNVSGSTAVIVLAVFTLALIVSLIIKPLRKQSVFPIAFASGTLACLLLVCVNEFYYFPQLSLAGADHTAAVKITSNAEINYDNWYYEGTATEIDGEKASVKMRLMFSSAPEIEPYDTITGTFTFYAFGSTSDEAASTYKSENRFLGAYSADENYNIIENTDKIKPLGYYILSFRSGVKNVIMRMLPNDYGALCTALVLGDRTELSNSAYSSLRACGVTHIICVSGLHISLWSSAILWALRKLKLREKTASLIAMPAVVFFMLAAGMTYSVVRSGIMMLIYLLSIVISRRRDSLNSLGIALTIIMVSNPFAAGSVSLQLSALSTLGIILYSEYCNPYVTEFFKKHSSAKIFEKPAKMLLITCAAVGFCLPVSVGVYGSFNFCVFPSNLLVVTAAEICMISTALGAVIASISVNIFNLPGLIAGLLAKYILKISELLSKIGFLNFHLSQTDAYMMLCGIFMLCALFVLVAYTGKKVMPLAAILVGTVVVITTVFCGYYDYGKTLIRVTDAGNGNAVIISHKGKNVLVGCGGDLFSTEYNINDGIEEAGGTLSAIIVPNNADYNTSCLYSVAADYDVKEIYCSDDILTAGLFSNVKSLDSLGSVGDINFQFYSDSNIVYITTDDINLAICFDPVAENYPKELSQSQVIISRMDYPENLMLNNIKLFVTEATNERGYIVQNELKAQGVNGTSTAECGNILITAYKGEIIGERY